MDNKECLVPCEGVFADVTKLEAPEIIGDYYEKLLKNYDKYKRSFDISDSKKLPWLWQLLYDFLGYQFPSKLKYVNIFFDTPTFDKITRDRSAKESWNIKWNNISSFSSL